MEIFKKCIAFQADRYYDFNVVPFGPRFASDLFPGGNLQNMTLNDPETPKKPTMVGGTDMECLIYSNF